VAPILLRPPVTSINAVLLSPAFAWTPSSGTMLALINGESLIGPIRIPD